MSCIFCDIVAGAAPAHRVYEDEHVLAFMDIRPMSPGHTLVVPKQHASGLQDLDPDLGALVFQAAHRIALALRHSTLRVDGVNLVLSDGRAAMQTVFHVHIHALPRRNGDKLRLASRALLRRPGDLTVTGQQVRDGLARLAG
jgi:diadenosine tetraphosphate (Ap4A) HIT family hydrolase